MIENHFILYSNCIPVRGASESIIMDLQRNNYLVIPNVLCDILIDNNFRDTFINTILKKYDYIKGLKAYFNYLEELELGFYTSSPYSFPPLSTKFDTPFPILSSIINYNSNYDINNVLRQLIDLGTPLLQIRIFGQIDLDSLCETVKILKESKNKLTEIFIENKNYKIKKLKKIVNSDLRLKVVLHSVNNIKKNNIPNDISKDQLFILKESISKKPKEFFSKTSFTSNIEFYTESLNYNVGLNRKVCVDFEGEIKNYVSHKNNFGFIQNTNLKELINNEQFKKKWNINNDKIIKCKDCQFRYMCLNNSDIMKSKNTYEKIDYCNYDPYENIWN